MNALLRRLGCGGRELLKQPGFMLIAALALALGGILTGIGAAEATSAELLPPTGQLPVGRTSYHWVLERLNAGAVASRFNGRMDLASVGAFGHSIGGRVAARTCQLEKRVKACLSLDGLARRPHFDENPDGSTLQQPFMVIRQPYKVPPDEVLARMKKTRDQLIEENRQTRRDFFESVRAGSYDVSVKTPDINHQSFTDLPLLESGQSEETMKARRRALDLTRTYLRAFFDRHLLGGAAPLLEADAEQLPEVEMTRYQFRAR